MIFDISWGNHKKCVDVGHRRRKLGLCRWYGKPEKKHKSNFCGKCNKKPYWISKIVLNRNTLMYY